MAKETGNKLTQNIDKNGNLIGINSTIESNLSNKSDNISVRDIQKELFDGGLKKRRIWKSK